MIISIIEGKDEEGIILTSSLILFPVHLFHHLICPSTQREKKERMIEKQNERKKERNKKEREGEKERMNEIRNERRYQRKRKD